MFLCFLICCLSVFISRYLVNLLHTLVLATWPYAVGILCGPVAQSPITCAGSSGSVPCVSCVFSCCEALIAFSMSVDEMTLELTGCGGWPRPRGMSCYAGADPMEWDLAQQALVPVDITLCVCHLWS